MLRISWGSAPMLNIDIQPLTARSYCWPAPRAGEDGYTATCLVCGEPCVPSADCLCVTHAMMYDTPLIRDSCGGRNDAGAISRRRYEPKQRHPPKELTEEAAAAKAERRRERGRVYYHRQDKAKQAERHRDRRARKKETVGG